MSRAFLLRLAQGVLLALLAPSLFAGCGGNDVVDSANASTDGASDGRAVDGSSDGREMETSSRDSETPDEGAGFMDAAPEAPIGSLDAANGGEATAVEAAVTADEGDATDAGSTDATIEGGTVAAPSLGAARTFAVLAGSTITNTGATTAIVGDVGISPGTALVALTAGQVTGTIHRGDDVAKMAEADLTTAFNDLAARPCQHTMTDVDLGGKTLAPGVYCFAFAAAQTIGDLTLDGQGNPNAVWIFQVGSTLTISPNLSTTMINAGNACNVYWQVGSSATINGGTQLKGNVFAQASISLLVGANVAPGRTLTQTAAVTMQSTGVSNAGCP